MGEADKGNVPVAHYPAERVCMDSKPRLPNEVGTIEAGIYTACPGIFYPI